MQGCLFAGDAHQTEPAGFRPKAVALSNGRDHRFQAAISRRTGPFPKARDARRAGARGQALRSGQRFSARRRSGQSNITADGEGQNRAGTAIDEEMAKFVSFGGQVIGVVPAGIHHQRDALLTCNP